MNKLACKTCSEKAVLLAPYLVFVLAAVIYSLLSLRFTVPIYFPADETLYVALAKSIFHGTYQVNRVPVSYDCLIYPLFLSFTYHFYSPEHITDIMRIFGIIAMCSASIPAWFIARKLSDRKAYAVGMSIVAVIIPEMLYGLFLLQETLAYPCFLWMIWLVLKWIDHKTTSLKSQIILSVCIGLSFFLLYGIKSYFLFLPGAWFLFLVYDWASQAGPARLKRNIRIFAITIAVFGLLYGMNQYLIQSILNQGMASVNHYRQQILFPFSLGFRNIGRLMANGLLQYVSQMFLTGYGLLVVIGLLNLKNMSKVKKDLFVFIVICLVTALFTIVFTIYIPEEYNHEFGLRIHFRYFFYYFVPLFMLVASIKWESSVSRLLGAAFPAIMLVYWFSLPEKIFSLPNQTGIDGILPGYLALLLGKIPYAYLAVIFLTTLLVLLPILCKRRGYLLKKIYLTAFILLFAVMLVVGYRGFSDHDKQINKDGLLEKEYISLAHTVNQYEQPALLIEHTPQNYDFETGKFSFYTLDDYYILAGENIKNYPAAIPDDIDLLMVKSCYDQYLFEGYDPIDSDNRAIALYAETADTSRVRLAGMKTNEWHYDALLFDSSFFAADTGFIQADARDTGYIAYNSPSLGVLEPGSYQLCFDLNQVDAVESLNNLTFAATYYTDQNNNLIDNARKRVEIEGSRVKVYFDITITDVEYNKKIEVTVYSSGDCSFEFDELVVTPER